MVLGLVLTIACSLLFAGTTLRTDPATPVLALARDVGAGQTIRDPDLKVVRIVPGDAVQVVGESQRETVVGRTAAVPLVAGSLLSPGQMGGSAFPPVGQSVIAVGVKAGKAPAGMTVGSRVTVLVVPPTANGSPAGQAVRASASVSAIEVPDAAGLTAVSLLLSSDAALQVSLASGDVSLILQGSGG
ncbi:SAF domain-containing protein [Micromonospora sp. WMMD736]|uniref:SAF domain-containing protein n=1 Tax=Micromonospora sp. WMMD736 TaxID=3404112 RepID=UPI003B963598